jgi:phosphate starvation-inducible membrane PsiE
VLLRLALVDHSLQRAVLTFSDIVLAVILIYLLHEIQDHSKNETIGGKA